MESAERLHESGIRYLLSPSNKIFLLFFRVESVILRTMTKRVRMSWHRLRLLNGFRCFYSGDHRNESISEWIVAISESVWTDYSLASILFLSKFGFHKKNLCHEWALERVVVDPISEDEHSSYIVSVPKERELYRWHWSYQSLPSNSNFWFIFWIAWCPDNACVFGIPLLHSSWKTFFLETNNDTLEDFVPQEN